MKDMDIDIDHYFVLGLPSGEEGAKLSQAVISKAYKVKALELHPDKRPDDPNANANFHKLFSSYEILKSEKARKLFDNALRVKREKESKLDSKRQRMVYDLRERERTASSLDPSAKARDEDKRIARKLKEEIARIRALMHANNNGAPTMFASKNDMTKGKKETYASTVQPVRNMVGSGYQAFEDDVLKKLQKAAEKQKRRAETSVYVA